MQNLSRFVKENCRLVKTVFPRVKEEFTLVKAEFTLSNASEGHAPVSLDRSTWFCGTESTQVSAQRDLSSSFMRRHQ